MAVPGVVRGEAGPGEPRVTADGSELLNPLYLPEEALKDENAGRCVHHVERAPKQPDRMFMQFHGGVYRLRRRGQELDRHRWRWAPV